MSMLQHKSFPFEKANEYMKCYWHLSRSGSGPLAVGLNICWVQSCISSANGCSGRLLSHICILLLDYSRIKGENEDYCYVELHQLINLTDCCAFSYSVDLLDFGFV